MPFLLFHRLRDGIQEELFCQLSGDGAEADGPAVSCLLLGALLQDCSDAGFPPLLMPLSGAVPFPDLLAERPGPEAGAEIALGPERERWAQAECQCDLTTAGEGRKEQGSRRAEQ